MRNPASIPTIFHAASRARRFVVGLLFVTLCFGSGLAGRLHLAQHDHAITDDHGHDLASAACTSGDDHAGFPANSHDDSHSDHEKDDGSTQHDPASCNVCLQLLLAKASAATSADAPAFLELIEVPDGRIIAVVKPSKSGTLTEAAPRGPPRT